MAEWKRYIAGAVCPDCGALDKIYVVRTDAGIVQHCNRCGFSATLGEDVAAADEWQPVRLPGPGTGHHRG